MIHVCLRDLEMFDDPVGWSNDCRWPPQPLRSHKQANEQTTSRSKECAILKSDADRALLGKFL